MGSTLTLLDDRRNINSAAISAILPDIAISIGATGHYQLAEGTPCP